MKDELSVGEDELYDLIYKKVNPLLESLQAEFEATEEYRVKREQSDLLKAHSMREYEFEEIYGKGTYKYCYDVFGELRNPEYLEKLKANKKASEEYQQRSYEEQRKRYKEYAESGGSSNDYGSYSSSSHGNYTDEEKVVLKEIYRMASKKFHPDITKDDGSKMKFITKLKEQWGL